MTKDQFLDNLFQDCEDALLDKDIKTVMDYFEKHYTDLNTDDFKSVFVTVIRNIMDKSDLEKYKQKFGYFLYLYLANLFGIQDVYIPQFKEKFKFNSHYWGDKKPFTFKTVTLEDGFDSASYFECDELIITGNNERGKVLNLSCKAKTITFNTYVESVTIDWCKNIYFDENAVIYEDKVPVLMKDFNTRNPADVEKVILPPVDYVQVPRWICSRFHSNKVTIYKRTGQKITVFSKQGEWLKEHVKSV